jgi:hypothetical protein
MTVCETSAAIHCIAAFLRPQLFAHQFRPMNSALKKFLAILIAASVVVPAVSFAKTTHHHHHKYTKAKQVPHTAH